MRKPFFALLVVTASLLATAPTAQAGGFEIGMGANYWHSLKEASDKEFDRDGLGWMVSSRIMFSNYFGIGLEVEKSPENFVILDEPLYIPAAYAILGNHLYFGVGFGGYYYEGDFLDKTWYAFRGGFKIPLLTSSLMLDLNVNYRFDHWESPEQAAKGIDTDTVMAGAALRLAF